MFGFKRILVPSDFSMCSQKAVRLAISMAVRYDSELFLITVSPGGPGAGAWKDNASARAEIDSLETEEQDLLEDYERAAAEVEDKTGLPEIPRERLKLRVAGGEPASEIIKAAEDAQVDLIVMGTHGRTSIKEFFVGSTTERVVERATCCVLSVKPDGYPYLRD